MRTQVLLTDEALDVAQLICAAGDDSAGAIVTFVGTVRRSSSVRSDKAAVHALIYDAHPALARQRLDDIAVEAGVRWELRVVVVAHRVGRCGLGEPTVVIACSAAHREAAFESSRWIIEKLKHSVPIWKCEVYDRGIHWIGMGS